MSAFGVHLVLNSGTLINVALLVGIVIAAVRVGAGKLKDATIKDLKERIDSLLGRVEQLDAELMQARDDAQECHAEAQKWQARYEEQSKYTARAGYEHFERMLMDHQRQVTERHEQMLEMGAALIEASRSMSELTMFNMAALTAIADHLDVTVPAAPPVRRAQH